MVTGIKKKDTGLITSDDILDRTTGGYDIYMYYLGKVSRIMQRPWGKKEKKLSWGIFPYNGIWMWKDQATEEAGSAIQFVEKYFNLSFGDACAKIIWDFQLRPQKGKQVASKSPIITWDEPTEEDKNYVKISFTYQPWKKEHYKFWEGTEVTPPHCEKYNTYAVKSCAIKRRIFKLKPNEVVWAYYCPEEDAVKLYFPERGYDEWNPKFRNNVSGNHLWNYDNLLQKCGDEPCEKGIIQKSMKDLLVTTLITDKVIASQNEQSKLFLSPHTIEKVGKLFKNVWMAFGSDPDGVAKSQKVTAQTGWNWVNPDKRLLPDINDFYGLAKENGLRAVEDLLKYKNFL
jgi:hypothetical protein